MQDMFINYRFDSFCYVSIYMGHYIKNGQNVPHVMLT